MKLSVSLFVGICILFLCLSSGRVISQTPSEFRARVQPSVPEGWTDRPFVETAPAPTFTESETERGYLLFQRPITEPVHPNTRPRDHERLNSLVAFATPGEFEPLTFSLYPERELKNLTVRCSDLTSASGRISNSQIDIRLLTYWNIGFPRYTSRETYRRLPELLERVTVHSSPAKECQRWWLTVHVPQDAKPGLYTGTVTLKDGGFKSPVKIPVKFRVLGFPLQSDPQKHLSAYYYTRNRTMFEGHDEAFVDRATASEYRSMVDHGMGMLPTFYLQFNRSQEKIVVQDAAEIDRMLAAGMKGPLPILAGNAIARIYVQTTPGGERGSHWQINKMPPPEFYQLVTELFRQLKQESAARGWPELICCPLDEVAASSNEFGSGVYKAVHDAGIRTYATKNPLATDAALYRPYVDVWCSQPYAIPYEKVVTDTTHQYWSYPNHNAGERKNRRDMCKGGRMTYGFGFWRSGYTTLIPWHWAWTLPPEPFDYLRSTQSGTGQRIDDRGEVIPAVYWECFREGWDDERYVYTLQQAIWERVGSPDPKCQLIVRQARAILQETWNAIEAQDKYLGDNTWPSDEFTARRWLLAIQIHRLLKFPAARQGVAPSVFLDDTAPVESTETSIVGQAAAQGKLESRDLGEDFSQWKPETPESSIQVVSATSAESSNRKGQPSSVELQWNVRVDHHSGGGEDGQYNVGWPRIRRTFKQGDLDLSTYDFLEVVLRVDSNRDEVQDDVTLLGFSFSSHDERRLYETSHDLGDRQREELRVQFSIPEMIRTADKGDAPWKSLAHLQLFIAEANYPDAAELQFDIQSVRLLRFKTPMISNLSVPRFLLLPRTSLAIPFEIMGTRPDQQGSYNITASLVDSSGRSHADKTESLGQNRLLVLDTAKLAAGKYRLDVSITELDGTPIHQSSKIITAFNGPG